jgi:hypothetical protein
MRCACEPLDVADWNGLVQAIATDERLALFGRDVHAHERTRPAWREVHEKERDRAHQEQDDEALPDARNGYT